MKKSKRIIASIMLLLACSCSKTGIQTNTGTDNSVLTEKNIALHGNASSIPAYYDSALLKIHFSEFSSNAEASLIAHNKSINFIYQSDNGLPNNQPFISVIDAVPGDGMNAIWREVQIVFNAGFTPRQLFSDNEVLALASEPNPEITLDTTNEVYWCPIVGTK